MNNTQTIHDTAYRFYSWTELGHDIFTLAQKILDTQPKYDRIVALAKGGLTFSRSLVDYLQTEKVSSIQIEFYTGINQTDRTPVITQSLPVTIRNEKILIFDDIADSGETLKLSLEYLQYHGAQSIQTATLFTKPQSIIKPDFTVHETSAWVIFPNEIRETINLLVAKWQKAGDSTEQITQQLNQIGLPAEEIEYFLRVEQ